MIRIKKYILKYLCWSLLLLSTVAQGQYFNFSQYDQTPLRVNPAYVVASDYEQVNLIYRNQNTAADYNINSSSFSYQRPLRFNNRQRHFLGFGISALDDRTGGVSLLSKQDIGLTTGVNIKLDESQTLNFGFSGLVKRLHFSLEGLTTGFQYDAGKGFDPNVFLGESFENDSKTTVGINAGVLWQKRDKKGNQLAHFGWSLYDLNKPKEYLKGRAESQLPGSNLFQLGVQVFKNKQLSVYSQLLVLLSGEVLHVNAGVVWEYLLPKGKKFSKLAVQTNYVVGSYGTLGVRLMGEKYSAGMSYDLAFGTIQVANAGAIEISLAYHKLVRAKRKPKAIIAEAEAKELEAIVEKIEEPIRAIYPEKVKVDSTSLIKEAITDIEEVVVEKDSMQLEGKEEATEVTMLSEYSPSTAAGELIYSNVRMEKVNVICEFDFNKSILKSEVRDYLVELGERLKDQNIIAIEVVGHTDAVGAADYNMLLSTRRAHAIATFLAEQGISWGKISVAGKGESQQIPGASDEENRRVEVLIFSQQ